jgi:hypothetical protein
VGLVREKIRCYPTVLHDSDVGLWL